MKKRFKFLCWNCDKTYTLQRQVAEDLVLFVACPYCGREAIADLNPFREDKKEILKGDNQEQNLGIELRLPETLPTQKLEAE